MNSAVSLRKAGSSGLQAPHVAFPVGHSSVASPHAIDAHAITTITTNVMRPCAERDWAPVTRAWRSNYAKARVSWSGALLRIERQGQRVLAYVALYAVLALALWMFRW